MLNPREKSEGRMVESYAMQSILNASYLNESCNSNYHPPIYIELTCGQIELNSSRKHICITHAKTYSQLS